MIAVAVIALDLVFIPFHAGDDPDHFALAWRVAHLQFGPVPAPTASMSSGAYVDAAIPRVTDRNWFAVRLEAKPGETSTVWARRDAFVELPMAAYLPLLHTPQALAVMAGETLNWTVERTVFAARIANGAAALAIAALALAALPEGFGGFALFLLCLPESLKLFASNSTDPLIHGVTLALVAFSHRALAGWRPSVWHFALAGLGVLAIGGERAPLVMLGALPALAAFRHRSLPGFLVIVAAVAGVGAWLLAVLPVLHDARCHLAGTIISRIVFFVQHAPAVMSVTLHDRMIYYWLSFFGELGYGRGLEGHLGHGLPIWFYWVGSLVLVLAVGSLPGAKDPPNLAVAAIVAVLAALLFVGLFLAMSAGCTRPGVLVVSGVQGRYLIEPLMLAGLSLTAIPSRWRSGAELFRLVLPVFLVLSAGTLIVEGLTIYAR